MMNAAPTTNATAHYDTSNIFARILRGEIPAKVVLESPHGLAFHDIQPKAAVHVLVIPRGPYSDLLSFSRLASVEEQIGFWQLVTAVAEQLNLAQDGFRLISNCGLNGGQEVPHFHVHLLGGQAIGRMVA
jgi:diadenosine tetraphosphate (Ap4A) HIT family hydrolase